MATKGHWPAGKRRNPAVRGIPVKLRKLLRTYGSRRKAAAAIGVSWSAVSRWVNEIDIPSPANVAKIQAAYARSIK